MLDNKKLFLFDIDGVLKLGDDFIEGASDLINFLLIKGKKVVFVSNNSNKSINNFVKLFQRNGFNVNYENFITAMVVTIKFLKKYHLNDLIYPVGTLNLCEELKKEGLNITNNYDKNIKVLLISYDDELNYKKITDACKILQTLDVDYIASNIDLTYTVPYGFLPDCKAIADMIESATKKVPKYLAKPSPLMIEMALNKFKFKKEDAVIIGDKIETDIACGINAGIETCLVLSGDATSESLDVSKIKPNYVFKSVRELYKSLITQF